MVELRITPSEANNVFWAMAVGIALLMCIITYYAPEVAWLAGDAMLCAVLVGWLTALWNSRKPSGPSSEAP